MTPEAMAERLIHSVHPEKFYDYLPGLTPANIAALYGVDEATYAAIRERIDARARQVAEELLAEPGFAAAVDALPFASGSTVLVVGESNTDDLDSWFEILRHLLDLRRPGHGVRLVNDGISGFPTTMLLRRLPMALGRYRPDWVIFFCTGNDIIRYGSGATKPLVSSEETVKNLAELRQTAAGTDARLVWMTPTTMIEEKAAAYPMFRQAQMSLRLNDVLLAGDAVRNQPDTVVDLQQAFGLPADPDLLQDDGVHPSLAGQRVIVKALVERLAGETA